MITDREVSNLCKAFSNNSSANEKLLKTQISKIKQSGGFLGKFLKPLMKICFPLMKSVLTHICKKFSRTIRINSSSISNICSFWKENFQIWNDNVVNSNEKTEYAMKVVKSLDDSDILIKGVTKAIENEIKNKLLDFLLWSSRSKFIRKYFSRQQHNHIWRR